MVGATLVVARFANPMLVVRVSRQGDHKPDWTTPILVVHQQGDHKGRPYHSFCCTPSKHLPKTTLMNEKRKEVYNGTSELEAPNLKSKIQNRVRGGPNPG